MVEHYTKSLPYELELTSRALQDLDELKSMLQDIEVMYAWEYKFSDDEVQQWVDKNLKLYEKHDMGYFIAEDKVSGKIVGQAALMPDVIQNKKYFEIGYILKKQFWHNGYATECARALAEYAFNTLNLPEVIFEIRPENISSIRVAQRLGAKPEGKFIKNVKGKNMVHLIYKLYKHT